MRAREVQAENMAKTLLKYGKNVTIIGKAYKPGVHYTNGSSSMLVGYYVEQYGGVVNYYDEHTGDTELKEGWTEVYLIGYWDKYVENLTFSIDNIATFVDPWRRLSTDKVSGQVIHYGNTRG
jgi:hypothetical protein